ncbi:hypothetical protein JRQ81_004372 [Phrynocephalus forsythii]|uniref:Uncharacterized protein n=1 Tax=Phrynocephalus forsythii TaxID=171643 RepID=A0A9Q0XF40_9SAUR|nr:hypothetical protein JRQ81_004372 [Phrynocephalus forsythii]
MGNWASTRKLEEAVENEELQPEHLATGSQVGHSQGLKKLFQKGQRAPREILPDPSEMFCQDLPDIPKELLSSWGRRGSRLRRAAQRSCPPLFSLTLWVAGDGGEREENYRYHRLMGNLVSSTVAEDDLPPPTWYEIPGDQVVRPPPPPPLRYLANGMTMAEGHHLPHLSLDRGLTRGE